jgi:hypothetical protein
VRRVVGAVAVVPAGPVEEGLDADLPAILVERDHVGILDGSGVDPLPGRDMGDRLQPVAEHGGLLEVQPLGRFRHLRLQLGLDLAGRAAEKAAHILDDASVVCLVDATDAGGGAALDLVLQAGPRPVVEDRIPAAP